MQRLLSSGGEIVTLVEYLVGRKSGRYLASHPSWHRRSENKFGRAMVADSVGDARTGGLQRQQKSGSGKTSLFNAKIYPTLAEQYDFQVFPTALVRGAIPKDLDIDKIPNLYIFNTLQSLNPNSNSIALQN